MAVELGDLPDQVVERVTKAVNREVGGQARGGQRLGERVPGAVLWSSLPASRDGKIQPPGFAELWSDNALPLRPADPNFAGHVVDVADALARLGLAVIGAITLPDEETERLRLNDFRKKPASR